MTVLRDFRSSVTRLLLLPTLMAFVALAAGCSSGASTSAETDTDTEAAAEAAAVAEAEAEAEAEVAAEADSSEQSQSNTGDSGTEVTIAQSRFEPADMAVATGDVVRFINTDPFAHTVTAAADSESEFASGDMGQDDVYEISFDEPGSYSYFCEIHPTMRGVIDVG